jgi:hypothetical protein
VETREPEVREEREWAVEAGNAEGVDASEAERASDVPRRALNTTSSGDGTSKAKGPSGASGMFAPLTAEDLCLGEEAFTLDVESSSGDVVVRP